MSSIKFTNVLNTGLESPKPKVRAHSSTPGNPHATLQPPPLIRKRFRVQEEEEIESPSSVDELKNSGDVHLDEIIGRVRNFATPALIRLYTTNIKKFIDSFTPAEVKAVSTRGYILYMGDLHDKAVKSYFAKHKESLGIKKIKRKIVFDEPSQSTLDYLKAHQSR
jgi:hypothetical protein